MPTSSHDCQWKQQTAVPGRRTFVPIAQLGEHLVGRGVVGQPVGSVPTADRSKADEVLHRIIRGERHQANGAVELAGHRAFEVVGVSHAEAAGVGPTGSVHDPGDRSILLANLGQRAFQLIPVGKVALMIDRVHARGGKLLERVVNLDVDFDASHSFSGERLSLIALRTISALS